MEVRDPVHGSIEILDEEKAIIEHPFFQRLRNIKQLGFSEYIFPGATHTRYIHSIGVMHVSTKVFDKVFRKMPSSNDKVKLRETLRLACLLHDTGHAPLSHTTEFVMPQVSELKLPTSYTPQSNRQATHEDYTIKAIVDSSFTASFKGVQSKYGVDCKRIADLILGKTTDSSYFTVNNLNYFPILHQLVSSEMDCDRMDYLLRDSYFCGVSYGKFDLDWIIDNLHSIEVNGECYLGISERAISTFDDFLLSRYHMFLMVYFHYKSVALEKLLKRYFKSGEYTIPADIESYLEHDDHYLMKVLRHSKDQWAKRIVQNDIPQKILETFGSHQKEKLSTLIAYLEDNDIDYIQCSSSGRLSKYYSNSDDITKFPLKVLSPAHFLEEKLVVRDIHEATDLFNKYSSSHSVNRIHCDFNLLSKKHRQNILGII